MIDPAAGSVQHHGTGMTDDLHVDGVTGRQFHNVDFNLDDLAMVDCRAAQLRRDQTSHSITASRSDVIGSRVGTNSCAR